MFSFTGFNLPPCSWSPLLDVLGQCFIGSYFFSSGPGRLYWMYWAHCPLGLYWLGFFNNKHNSFNINNNSFKLVLFLCLWWSFCVLGGRLLSASVFYWWGGVRLPGEVGEPASYEGAPSPWRYFLLPLMLSLGTMDIALRPLYRLKYKKLT